MSEEKKVFKMPFVANDAIITIEISGSFMKKVQNLLLAIGEQAGQEKLKMILEKFRDTQQVPYDIEEASIFILMALVGEMESQAMKQGKVEYKEMTAEELAKNFNK